MDFEFGIAAAVAASGVPADNIRAWDRRELLREPLQPSGRGKTRLYSRPNVYEFTLLGECSRLGLRLSLVADHASRRAVQTMIAAEDRLLAFSPADEGNFQFVQPGIDLDDLRLLFAQASGGWRGRRQVDDDELPVSICLIDLGALRRRVDAVLDAYLS